MNVKERIMAIKLAEKLEKHKSLEKIISVKTVKKNKFDKT
jgi:hypothetical protein